MTSSAPKKEEVYAFQTLYRELGYYIARLEQYERALKYFDLAISKAPTDRRALVGRAWARSKACHYEEALSDIRTALDLDPDDMLMLAHKALITFLNCEFEDGLVQNTRLMPKRQKPECFKVGAMHCADAIENCLGERTGRPLRNHYLIIRRLAWRKNCEAQKKPYLSSRRKKKLTKKPQDVHAKKSLLATISSQMCKRVNESDHQIIDQIYSEKTEQNIDPPRIKFPYHPLQKYTTNIQNFMAEKYLHTLYRDKLFLQNMRNVPGVESPNEAGTAKILHLAKSGYKAVKYDQELLRTRRPFYFIKYQEARSSGALKARQEEELNKLRVTAKQDADYIVVKMKEALENKKWFTVIELAEKLKGFCKTSKKILPNREEYLQLIYDTVCQAHFDLKRLNPDQREWDTQKRIYKLLGLQLSREPSTDSVVAQIEGVFVDWRKQVNVYNDRLRRATNSRELCWLFHELGRFHIELKQYEVARVYAKKCMNEAERIHKNKWIINALMLLMRINIAQHSKNDAKADALEAITVAEQMGDPKLVEFFRKCRDVIEDISFDQANSSKVLLQREKKILEMMAGDKMRDEAAHLFRAMSVIPSARRMTMIPGIRLSDSNLKKKSTKRLSIMPTKREEEFIPNKEDKKKLSTNMKYNPDD